MVTRPTKRRSQLWQMRKMSCRRSAATRPSSKRFASWVSFQIRCRKLKTETILKQSMHLSLRPNARHRQPMAVLHGGVAHVTELCFPPGGLAVETAVGIASARMRVVFALLAVEVGPVVVVATAVLGAETLVRGPRLDQRSVHR